MLCIFVLTQKSKYLLLPMSTRLTGIVGIEIAKRTDCCVGKLSATKLVSIAILPCKCGCLAKWAYWTEIGHMSKEIRSKSLFACQGTAAAEERENIPFHFAITIGPSSSCSYDFIHERRRRRQIISITYYYYYWLHVLINWFVHHARRVV